VILGRLFQSNRSTIDQKDEPVFTNKKKLLIVTAAVLLAGILLGNSAGIINNNFLSEINKYIIWDRIVVPIYLTLTSPEENIRTTKLPVYEIDIKGKYLDELNADIEIPAPDTPLEQRFASCLQYKPAVFRYNGMRYRVQMRYRGGNAWHFLPSQKSLRIKFKKNDRFDNQRLINLLNPKTTSAMVALMGYDLAERMGLLAPKSYPVHTVINRRFTGVSVFVEQIDEYFMINHGLAEGDIYYGEHNDIWKDPYVWTCRIETSTQSEPFAAIKRLVKVVNSDSNKQFQNEIGNIIDLDQWFSVYSHALICADTHRNNVFNHKYYLDPTTSLLRMIIWDPLGYAWTPVADPYDNRWHVNLIFNQLDGRMLQIPEFVERKNIRLLQSLNTVGSLQNQLDRLDYWYNLIQPDMYCDIYKDEGLAMPVTIYTNNQFEESVTRQRKFIVYRDQFLRKQLDFADCTIAPDKTFSPQSSVSLSADTTLDVLAAYIVVNAGECGVKFPSLSLRLTDSVQSPDYQRYLIYHDTNDNGRLDPKDTLLDTTDRFGQGHSITFAIKGSLLPARKKISPLKIPYFQRRCPDYDLAPSPARHRFFVAAVTKNNHTENRPYACFEPLRQNDILAVNSVTTKPISVKISCNYPSDTVPGVAPFDPQNSTRINQTLLWGPGLHRITKDLIIPRTTKLIIKPGTTVQLDPDISVLTYGPVQAQGSPDEPITFCSIDPENAWGALALQGPQANGSRFIYCRFIKGRDDTLNGVFYSGMLNAYNCDILLENCLIAEAKGDDGVNFKFGNGGIIRNCQFRDNSADALDLDFSDALVENCRFTNNRNDGIDLGSASATIRNNTIIGCGDKGISMGEMSYPKIYNNTISDNNVGLASKDMSEPICINNTITNNRTGIACYQKKRKFGPSKISLVNCIIMDNQTTLAADMNSSLSIHHCQLPANAVIEPLPARITDNPPARTKMVRPIGYPLMNIENNLNQTASPDVLTQAGDIFATRQISPDYTDATAPIGVLKP